MITAGEPMTCNRCGKPVTEPAEIDEETPGRVWCSSDCLDADLDAQAELRAS